MALAARDQDVPGSELSLMIFERVSWPNPALDCPQPSVLYAAVVTPGWRFVIGRGERRFEYHSDLAGDTIVTCDVHAAPGPMTINIARAAGLEKAASLEITRRSPEGDIRVIAEVSDQDEIARFVQVLDLEVALEPRSPCEPLGEIKFNLPDRVVDLGFFCGESTVLRGEQAFFTGRDARVPPQLGDLVGPYWAAAGGDQPPPPPEQPS